MRAKIGIWDRWMVLPCFTKGIQRSHWQHLTALNASRVRTVSSSKLPGLCWTRREAPPEETWHGQDSRPFYGTRSCWFDLFWFRIYIFYIYSVSDIESSCSFALAGSLETMFSNIAGVIHQEEQDRFARMLFRATRGTFFHSCCFNIDSWCSPVSAFIILRLHRLMITFGGFERLKWKGAGQIDNGAWRRAWPMTWVALQATPSPIFSRSSSRWGTQRLVEKCTNRFSCLRCDDQDSARLVAILVGLPWWFSQCFVLELFQLIVKSDIRLPQVESESMSSHLVVRFQKFETAKP